MPVFSNGSGNVCAQKQWEWSGTEQQPHQQLGLSDFKISSNYVK